MKFYLKINRHPSIRQALNASCPMGIRIDRAMGTFWTTKFLPFQTLNDVSIT